MHRWLRTTAPLLIGSIAVGTIHAAPAHDICVRKNWLSKPARNTAASARSADGSFRYALHQPAASNADMLRVCASCHDGTIGRAGIDMHETAAETAVQARDPVRP